MSLPASLPAALPRRRFLAVAGAALVPIRPASSAAAPLPVVATDLPTHWVHIENDGWEWFSREAFRDGRWNWEGITPPTHKQSGRTLGTGRRFLERHRLPSGLPQGHAKPDGELLQPGDPRIPHRPDARRRAAHGKPPSKWLRTLDAEALRDWLATIEVPQADVVGMTFWVHLTRDHRFAPDNLEGLTIPEQAKLHAAAHFGY